MTLNGAIVARRIGLPVYEIHLKLLLKSTSEAVIRDVYEQAVIKNGSDHEGDAIVAAWCATMGHTREWTVELYSDIEDDIELVVPEARYPWFETI